MKAKEIIDLMNQWANPKLIDDWDNTGFQIGHSNKDIHSILISLDLDNEVLEKALDQGFQMIITHHPIIFKPITKVTTDSYKEKLLYDLIRNDIVVYNAHSNLDQATGGVNDQLAKLLGLKDPIPLNSQSLLDNINYGYGNVGEIEETSLEEYIKIIKEKLNADYLVVYGETNKSVKKVALCGGSGSEFIYDAYMSNACIYITGDIKYHDAQLGNELGLTIIDAGHYNTEKIIIPVIKEYLDMKTKHKLNIKTWEKPSPQYKIY